MNLRELLAQKIQRMAELTGLDSMSDEQIVEFDKLETEVRSLQKQIADMEARQQRAAALSSELNQRSTVPERQAPAVLRNERGDSEAKSWKVFFRSGDSSSLKHLRSADEETGRVSLAIELPAVERRAVVDSTMNITTAADGGNVVPTGLASQVATRKNELMLAPRIGCRLIPGIGTTVGYPYESADPEVFATTSEQADNHGTSYERGAVPTGLKNFTLVKKTRKVELTEELLEDSAINVQSYVANRVAREIAKTHNAMLAAEVIANGTSFKTFAGAAAIAAGEPEAILGNDSLGFYLEDGAMAGWIMRSSTHWAINALTGNPRLYAGMEQGLLGQPVYHSNAVAALGASAKPVLFGAWDYLGYRESPQIRFISDPYSVDGLIILKYNFRAVYGVLQAAAVGYGVNAAS